MYIFGKEKDVGKYNLNIPLLLLLCMLVGGMGLLVYSQTKMQKNAITKSLERQQEEVKKAEVNIEQLFDLKDKNFISEDMTSEKITNAAKKLNDSIDTYTKMVENRKNLKTDAIILLENHSNSLLSEAKQKLNIQEEINKLYQKKEHSVVLNGKLVDKELAIADDLTSEKINSIKIKYVKNKPQNMFEKTVYGLVLEAERQEIQIRNLEKKIDQLCNNEEAITTDQTEYDYTRQEVNKIKNEKVKRILTERLDQFNSDRNQTGMHAEEDKN